MLCFPGANLNLYKQAMVKNFFIILTVHDVTGHCMSYCIQKIRVLYHTLSTEIFCREDTYLKKRVTVHFGCSLYSLYKYKHVDMYSRIMLIVRDHLVWVHNVVLIECIFGSGKPRGVGILGKGSTWATGNTKGGQFTSNREQRWTDPVTARRVPSK
jgi:hypothetical protein